MIQSESLGHKIACARKKAHFSQTKLAEHLLISRQMLNQWERNETIPDQSMLTRLSEILHIKDIHYFQENRQEKSMENNAIDFFIYMAQYAQKKPC